MNSSFISSYDAKRIAKARDYTTGQRFGSLIAVKIAEYRGNVAYWLCECDCGKLIIASIYALRHHKVKYCGRPMCLYQAMLAEHKKKQGL